MSLCVKKAPGDPHWGASLAKITLTHHASLFDVHVESCNTHHASRFTHHASRITLHAYVKSWLQATTSHTRDAWSVMAEAWCVLIEIIENRKSDSTCTSCVMRDAYSFWARVFTASLYTMTSFYGFSRVPPKIFACDQRTTCWSIRILHSLFFVFCAPFFVTLSCHATWLMIHIWGIWSIWLRSRQHYYDSYPLK